MGILFPGPDPYRVNWADLNAVRRLDLAAYTALARNSDPVWLAAERAVREFCRQYGVRDGEPLPRWLSPDPTPLRWRWPIRSTPPEQQRQIPRRRPRPRLVWVNPHPSRQRTL
jgi:hypothetical protein